MEMTLKLEIGLYDGLVSFSPDFFKIGVTKESLKQAGKKPLARDRFNR